MGLEQLGVLRIHLRTCHELHSMTATFYDIILRPKRPKVRTGWDSEWCRQVLPKFLALRVLVSAWCYFLRSTDTLFLYC